MLGPEAGIEIIGDVADLPCCDYSMNGISNASAL